VVLITSFHLRNSKVWQRRMFLSPSMTTMVLMCGVRDVVGNVGTIVFSPHPGSCQQGFISPENIRYRLECKG
jgi:hypothetical protein